MNWRAGEASMVALFSPSKRLLLAVLLLLSATLAAGAAPLRIVAIGASNTSGFYMSEQDAYPALLQRLLKKQGVEAEVTNAGVAFDTTAAMLRRIDRDVPKGTDIVILQPGANDLRFFGTKAQRSANIAEMERRLRARGIKVIVYDEDVPLRYYAFDFIHFSRAGHEMIAAWLLPRVMALVGKNHRGGGPSDKTH